MTVRIPTPEQRRRLRAAPRDATFGMAAIRGLLAALDLAESALEKVVAEVPPENCFCFGLETQCPLHGAATDALAQLRGEPEDKP